MANHGQDDPELRRLLEGELQRAQFQQQALAMTDVCWDKCKNRIGRCDVPACGIAWMRRATLMSRARI